MLPVVILAGGLASRVYPLSKTIPKSLIEINGEPFIFHQLKYLESQGVKKVVICIGHMGEKIKDQVGNGYKFNLKIEYSNDGNKLLGTGGAVKKALNLLGENFIIQYGDSFLPTSYSNIIDRFYNTKSKLLLTIKKNYSKYHVSNVFFKKNKIIEYNKFKFNSKMKYIDYGLCVVDSIIFDNYKKNVKFDLGELFYDYSIQGNLNGIEIREKFYEIGSFNGIKKTSFYLRKKKI